MEDTYKTKDLSEAGVLLVKKHVLIEMKREKNVCWFVFSNKNECEKLSNQFFFGEILVNAREYIEIINKLKNRIFSIINEYGNNRKYYQK